MGRKRTLDVALELSFCPHGRSPNDSKAFDRIAAIGACTAGSHMPGEIRKLRICMATSQHQFLA
jgi:hypothetical protein